MSDRSNSRLVFSTATGAVCPKCGWPAINCKCRSAKGQQTVPDKLVAKLRMEKAGRGGKTVTVVDGLPDNDALLKELCAELKRACGTGGAVKDGTIELQGEQREKVREVLRRKNFTVKG